MGLGRIIIGGTRLATKMRPRQVVRMGVVIPEATLVPVEALDAADR